MNYEKKYNDALERAKGMWEQGMMPERIEHIFPELRESEDEKIKNEIIKFLELPHPQFVGKRHQEEWIAWLEKQKEQKSAEYLDKDMVYAIMNKLHDLTFSHRIPFNSDEYKKIGEITSDVRRLLDYPIEQKSAEWSEEDKDKLNHILEIVHIAPGREVSVDEKEELESFLNSLRPQPKQEWSKEYERIRKDIERFLKQHNGWSKENKERMLNDLLQRL